MQFYLFSSPLLINCRLKTSLLADCDLLNVCDCLAASLPAPELDKLTQSFGVTRWVDFIEWLSVRVRRHRRRRRRRRRRRHPWCCCWTEKRTRFAGKKWKPREDLWSYSSSSSCSKDPAWGSRRATCTRSCRTSMRGSRRVTIRTWGQVSWNQSICPGSRGGRR